MVAADTDSILVMAILILVAFVPSIVYVVWVRNLERHGREPWRKVARAFLWGAIGGVVLALLLGLLLPTRPDALTDFGLGPTLFLAVVFAPLSEEFAKALGLRWVKDRRPEPEDGLVYGAAAGFGFASTENVLYFIAALTSSGVEGFILTAIVRSISSSLLHGSATALVGFAMWRMRVGHGGFAGLLGFYLLASALHGVFNLAASTELLVGFLFAVVLAIGVFRWMLRRIRYLDRRLAHAA